MLLKIVVLSLLCSATSVFATPDASNSQAPKVHCLDLAKRLNDLYTKLYNVDTRPLTFDMYRTYRDGVQNLHEDAAELASYCSGPTAQPKTENLYREKDLNWTMGVSDVNPCRQTDFSFTTKDFQETAIRECDRDGYHGCDVFSIVRVYEISGVQNQDATWTCSGKMDVVISGTK